MSLLLIPLTGIMILLIRGRNSPELAARQVRHGKMKKCRGCGELLAIDAATCRYCGHLQAERVDEVPPEVSIASWFADLPGYLDVVLVAAIVLLLIFGALQL